MKISQGWTATAIHIRMELVCRMILETKVILA